MVPSLYLPYLFASATHLPCCSSHSWVRWRWTARSSRCVSRSTARCSLKPWRLPWTAWTPWTRCLCPDASGWEATVTFEPLTKGVRGMRKEKEEDRCFCCLPPHHAHLPPPSEPSRAAQVGGCVWRRNFSRKFLWLCQHPNKVIAL